jgi:hypothetical protein
MMLFYEWVVLAGWSPGGNQRADAAGETHTLRFRLKCLFPCRGPGLGVEIVNRAGLAYRHTKRAVGVGVAVVMVMKGRNQDQQRDGCDEQEREEKSVVRSSWHVYSLHPLVSPFIDNAGRYQGSRAGEQPLLSPGLERQSTSGGK